jgi:3-deoxy-7-phosphoheptulonate synthase
MSDWSPVSWRALPAVQQPIWPDEEALSRVTNRMRFLPPLVSMGEVDALRAQLAEVAQGKRFILQGGDCAERFTDCSSVAILRKLKILLQMSLVITHGARRPVVRLGRIAGQYAKPRSNGTETIDGVELPVYRGDNVNDMAATPEARRPDPERLERGYFYSVATINFVRALLEGGFASLREPEHWQLDFISNASQELQNEYSGIADRIRDAIDYLESLGPLNGAHAVDFYTSHEGLILPLEEALTRTGRRRPGYYNLGAHFLWIGERTRALDGAHVEYFRGIRNPIGLKVGPKMTPGELIKLIDRLDPDGEPGRLTLITRMGVASIRDCLPSLIRAVKATGRLLVWSCDPMHGNTQTIEGVKTRAFDDVVAELAAAHEIHRAEGTHLGGVHFELTGDNVTECVGGLAGLGALDLKRSYQTGCDPRLNYAQSLEIAFLISRMLKESRASEITRRASGW